MPLSNEDLTIGEVLKAKQFGEWLKDFYVNKTPGYNDVQSFNLYRYCLHLEERLAKWRNGLAESVLLPKVDVRPTSDSQNDGSVPPEVSG